VGKSSLISTFVSRYFAEVVPGLMTRVRLPPDPSTHCVTTLVDSQHGDAALVQWLSTRRWHEQQQQQKWQQPQPQQQQQQHPHQPQQQRRGDGESQPAARGGRNTPTLPLSASTNSLQAFWEASALAADTSGATTSGTASLTTNPTTLDAATATGSHGHTSNAIGSSGFAEHVDSIILVYDLDRVETFFRLESHWLPLIERCYQGKVGLFGTLPKE
jgi:hypothetical protein